jgi:hypothetical protein
MNEGLTSMGGVGGGAIGGFGKKGSPKPSPIMGGIGMPGGIGPGSGLTRGRPSISEGKSIKYLDSKAEEWEVEL